MNEQNTNLNGMSEEALKEEALTQEALTEGALHKTVEELADDALDIAAMTDEALEIVYNAMNEMKPAPTDLKTFKRVFYNYPDVRAMVQAFALQMLIRSTFEE